MLKACIRKNKKKAAIQCVKLLGQKNPESIVEEGEDLYSHTNLRSRKRLLLVCSNLKECSAKMKLYTNAKYHRCIGFFVIYWDAAN